MANDIFNAIIGLLEKRGPILMDGGLEGHDYRYLDEGHVDSIGLIQFILEVEEIFDISLNPEDTGSEQFRTVNGLCKIVEKKINSKI